jgi:8-oxo-dGTP pyrophosphatase MutT (NUDIX family)
MSDGPSWRRAARAPTAPPAPSGAAAGAVADTLAGGVVLYTLVGGRALFLLLCSRKLREWAPPKGKAEPREDDLVACALRELCEETGLRCCGAAHGCAADAAATIALDAHFSSKTSYQTAKHGLKETHYFLAQVPCTPAGEPPAVELSREHTAFVWLPLAQAQERAAWKEMRDLLAAASARIAAKHGSMT